jgi:endonuclease I
MDLYEIEQSNKPLAKVLSGARKKWRGRDSVGDLTNVQYKLIWNCHSESPSNNEHILIKN